MSPPIIQPIMIIINLKFQMRNRLLKKALIRERRNTEERQQRQRRQVETREALSIIAAASSSNELSTFLHDGHGAKVLLRNNLEIN